MGQGQLGMVTQESVSLTDFQPFIHSFPEEYNGFDSETFGVLSLKLDLFLGCDKSGTLLHLLFSF